MSAVYIHIPFCHKRCFYCDFYTQLIKNKSVIKDYINAVIKEIFLRSDFLKQKKLKSIFLGGGTPSMLSIFELVKIFDALARVYHWNEDTEITIEANPEDLTATYVSELNEYTPINRISIGIQSFQDKILKFLGRNHSAGQARKSIELVKKYYENVSADLIFGVKNQRIAELIADIEILLNYNLPHISTYSLMIEEGSIFYILKKKKNKNFEADELLYQQMFEKIVNLLEKNNYLHYEISNFAYPDFISIHNWNYWTGGEYIGLGASSHSYNGQCRCWNVANYLKYIKNLNQNNLICEKEILTQKDKFNEYILTRLRTYKGLNINELREVFPNFYNMISVKINDFIQNGFLEFFNTHFIRLTKSGVMISDKIMTDLII